MKLSFTFCLLIVVLGYWFHSQETIGCCTNALEPIQTAVQTAEDKQDLNLGKQQTVVTTLAQGARELYESGKLSRVCSGVPSSNEALSEWVSNAYEDNEPFEYINDMQERFETCVVKQEVNESYIDLLVRAARQGSDEAVAELWSIGDLEFAKQISSFNKDPSLYKPVSLQLFKDERYKLARALAITGAEQSLLILIKAYQGYDPTIKQQNLVQSLAFAEFALNTLGNGDTYRKAFWFKEQLTKKLSYEEVLKAQIIADELNELFSMR